MSQRVPVRAWWVSASLLLATVVAGAAVRFAPLGLPWVLRKYGGSALWAMAVYWVVSAVLGRVGPVCAGVCAGVAATGVEWFKLYRSPGVDAFRGTIAGVLLLGREFSFWDIAVYWIAILFAAWLDSRFRQSRGL